MKIEKLRIHILRNNVQRFSHQCFFSFFPQSWTRNLFLKNRSFLAPPHYATPNSTKRDPDYSFIHHSMDWG